jgi:D-sedoheptulose 7-phosphate isomerase
MEKFISDNFDDISECFSKLKTLSPIVKEVGLFCAEAIKKGNKIMFCGNGGSASDSQHLAAELVGKYKLDRKSFNAVALTTNSSILTAVINDYGFDTVFERQVEGVGKTGDVLFGLSTSGQSKNVINAFKKAKEMGIKTIAMTGNKDCELIKYADYKIQVPSSVTNRIQEMHIAIGHLICDIIEKELTK